MAVCPDWAILRGRLFARMPWTHARVIGGIMVDNNNTLVTDTTRPHKWSVFIWPSVCVYLSTSTLLIVLWQILVNSGDCFSPLFPYPLILHHMCIWTVQKVPSNYHLLENQLVVIYSQWKSSYLFSTCQSTVPLHNARGSLLCSCKPIPPTLRATGAHWTTDSSNQRKLLKSICNETCSNGAPNRCTYIGIVLPPSMATHYTLWSTYI